MYILSEHSLVPSGIRPKLCLSPRTLPSPSLQLVTPTILCSPFLSLSLSLSLSPFRFLCRHSEETLTPRYSLASGRAVWLFHYPAERQRPLSTENTLVEYEDFQDN